MAQKRKNSNYATEKRAQAAAEKAALARKRRNIALAKEIGKLAAIILVIAGVIVGVCALAGAFDYNPKATVHVTVKLSNNQSLDIELYGNDAPETVAFFLSKAQSGFYDGLPLHTFIDGLLYGGQMNKGVVQGGIKGEFSANGFKNKVSHKRGVISMSRNADDFNSAYGQFFIVTENSRDLDGNYAAFGRVISGMDIIDEMLASATIAEDGTIATANRITITDITSHTH